MMITGGDPKEEASLKRADRAMIREALLMATRDVPGRAADAAGRFAGGTPGNLL